MTIDFGYDRWEKIKEDARLWWSGKLERPLIQLALWGRDPGRPEPATPAISRSVLYDLSISPEEIVDRWDYELSCQKFMGDAFPTIHSALEELMSPLGEETGADEVPQVTDETPDESAIDLEALAEKIVALIRQDLEIERERLVRTRRW